MVIRELQCRQKARKKSAAGKADVESKHYIGSETGQGKPFNWSASGEIIRAKKYFRGYAAVVARKCILAGCCFFWTRAKKIMSYGFCRQKKISRKGSRVLYAKAEDFGKG